MLFCKNCGGKLILDGAGVMVQCEHCGSSQALRSIMSGAQPLYAQSKEAAGAISTYLRAMNMYNQGESVQMLDTAAQMFESIPQVFRGEEMALLCRQKSEELAKENSYKEALAYMRSEDSRQISHAVETLHLLAGYRDAGQMEARARQLLEIALQKEKRREAAKIKAKRIKGLIHTAILAVMVLVTALVILGRAARYDVENLELSLTPCQDYLTVKGNRYIFYYEVEMENAGKVDIQAFRADVVIEDADGKVLVDTQMQAQDSNALVRGSKSREMTWQLTVNEEAVAAALYEDFYDLDVSITVTQIEFADGKVKDY